MPIAAVAPMLAGGSILSGIFGASSANKAANAQVAAANQAAALQQQALNFQMGTSALNRNDIFPWMSTGANAINQLNRLMGMTGAPPSPSWAQYAQNPQYAAQQAALWGMSPQQRMSQGGPVQMNGQPANIAIPGMGSSGGMMQPSTLAQLSGGGAQMAAGAMEGLQSSGMNPNAQVGGVQNMGGGPTMDPATGQPVIPQGGMSQGGAAGGGMGGFDPLDPTGTLGPDGTLSQGWNQQFVAPTGATEMNDPGYQFRLQQGQQALENSAAARGGLLSGGTGKALQQFGQDYASNEYGNVYNRALGQYQQNYNIFQNNQSNLFNRLSALAGGGQVAANNLQGGQLASANQIGNTYGMMGQDYQNAGNARASGYVGAGNAYGNMFSNLGSLGLLSQILGNH